MRKGGFHIQYNIVDSRMLREAQRVQISIATCWCACRVYPILGEIGKPIQDEVIARTEYEGV